MVLIDVDVVTNLPSTSCKHARRTLVVEGGEGARHFMSVCAVNAACQSVCPVGHLLLVEGQSHLFPEGSYHGFDRHTD